MKTIISFIEWKTMTKESLVYLAKGFVGLTLSLFSGIISLCRAFWRFLVRCVGNYPSVSLATFLTALFLVWVVTFATMRARAVVAEDQRDSIAYQYDNFKELHGYE